MASQEALLLGAAGGHGKGGLGEQGAHSGGYGYGYGKLRAPAPRPAGACAPVCACRSGLNLTTFGVAGAVSEHPEDEEAGATAANRPGKTGEEVFPWPQVCHEHV